MRQKATFPMGGIHPREMKHQTEHLAIENAPIPAVSVVPLQQHIGGPAECLVNPGDKVKEGMLIGRASGFVSAQIHSPVPGTVKEIRDIVLPSGVKTKAVVIELEGEFDRLGKRAKTYDWEKFTREQLLAAIADKGVVGMGGATFPTHVKFTLPKGSKAEYFVLNGAECEPYLTADHRLMVERAADIVDGVRIISRVLEPEHMIIAIEDNKPDALHAMEEAVAASRSSIKVVALKTKYPQGDEKQLIKAVTGREVPSGGLPLDVGVVAANAGTVLAIYEALVLQKPVMERVVTVSGGAVKKPGNYKVRIGTTFADLIQECGGFASLPEKIISGGPMMGFAVMDLDTPVIKGTSGILCLTSSEISSASRTNCLNCGRCVRACPMGLNPTRLFKSIDHMETAEALADGLMDCRECGCCSYVCPAHIPLVQGFRLGKKLSRKKKVAK